MTRFAMRALVNRKKSENYCDRCVQKDLRGYFKLAKFFGSDPKACFWIHFCGGEI
jgi:hypothetical protein